MSLRVWHQLAILAHDRLRFAWPALLTWAGDDLHLLRDRAVLRAKSILDKQLDLPPPGRYPAARPNEDTILAATIGYIQALYRSGRRADAIALARDQVTSLAARDLFSFARSRYTILLADPAHLRAGQSGEPRRRQVNARS